MPKSDFINELGVVDTLESDTAILGLFGKYRPLSNFHTEDILVDRLLFKCSEAAYMAQKTLVLEEKTALTQMLGLEAKRYGQIISIVPNWNEIRYERMYTVILAKFTQCEYLKELLLSTGDKYIEETNWWKDTYWGVCDRHGQNNLGRILMAVRGKLNES